MGDLLRKIDLEPIGRIVPRDIAVDLLGRPIGELVAELGLRHRDAARAVDLGEAAGQHRLGLVIERAQELRLPAVPHAGADRADVGGGQDGEELHALERLHDRAEILDRPAVGEVARLRDRRHGEMLLDQPGDGLGIGRRKVRSAGRAGARCARRRSNGPRSGPWRCRAGTARRRAPRGAPAGSCAPARWRARIPRACRHSISASTPMQRSRCSSTV